MFGPGLVSRPVDAHHQRFVESALPLELQRETFTVWDRTRYHPAVLARGRAAWQSRTVDAESGLRRSSRLLADLADLGAGAQFLGLVTRVVRDKDRHVELCRRMVMALGGQSVPGTTPRAELVRTTDGALPVRVMDQVLRDLCIGESLAARLHLRMRKQATESLAQNLLRYIAADEAVHAQLGWQLVETMLPRLSPRERLDLQELLPTTFRAIESTHERRTPTTAGRNTGSHGPLHPFGSLDAAARAVVYVTTMDRAIERLEVLGFPARLAWRHRTID